MADPLAPGFLIAMPQLLDENFQQSVVLLLQQSSAGSIGVVVNHESPLLLFDLCQDHELPYSGSPEKLVRRGGPVQPDQGLVLYGPEHLDPEGRPVIDGLHVSASRTTLGRLCKLRQGRFQCYSGYAGWGAGQLEQELQDGAWLTSRVDPLAVLEQPPEVVWRQTLHAMGIDPAMLVAGGGGEA